MELETQFGLFRGSPIWLDLLLGPSDRYRPVNSWPMEPVVVAAGAPFYFVVVGFLCCSSGSGDWSCCCSKRGEWEKLTEKKTHTHTRRSEQPEGRERGRAKFIYLFFLRQITFKLKTRAINKLFVAATQLFSFFCFCFFLSLLSSRCELLSVCVCVWARLFFQFSNTFRICFGIKLLASLLLLIHFTLGTINTLFLFYFPALRYTQTQTHSRKRPLLYTCVCLCG